MNELDDWDDDELLTFYELIMIIRDTKYANTGLIEEIQKLDTLRTLLRKFSFKKLDILLSALARLVGNRRSSVNKDIDDQENT